MGTEDDSTDIKFTGEVTLTNINESIIESLSSIEKALTTIASSSGNDIASWVIPALAGAFSAYLFNLIHWLMVEKKQENSKLNKALYDVIEKLENSSIQYWLAGSDDATRIQNKQLELSIKSLLTIMRKNNKSLISKLNKKIINPKRNSDAISKLKEFESEIFDVITGDEFETQNRQISNSKAAQISSQCSEIRAFLSNIDYS